MHRLGLSKGALYDGFPMLHSIIFEQPTILSAMNCGFRIDPQTWPLKDTYPSIASKRAQVLTYSENHFLVRLYTFVDIASMFPSFPHFFVLRFCFTCFYFIAAHVLHFFRGMSLKIFITTISASFLS
jgi:hypothetical protein